MIIALIDDGINCEDLQGIRVVQDLSVDDDGTVIERRMDDPILTDHGTTCARIISMYAPEAEFVSIRIFHGGQLETSCGQLAAALEWCLRKKVPLIHMSLGTKQLVDYQQLQPVVSHLLEERQIIVSAYANKGLYSIPACISGVFGVVADEGLADSQFLFRSHYWKRGMLCASSQHRLKAPDGSDFVTQISNSYAAPTVTAAIYKVLIAHEPFTMTIPMLYKELTDDERSLHFPRPDFLHNAIIINPDKHPLIEQRLFFKCIAKYSAMDEALSAELEEKSLVYLPSRDQSINVAEMILLSAHNGNVVYCGVFPQNVYLENTSGLVWSEDNFNLATVVDNSNGVKINCPVIRILGKGHKPVEFLCRLRDLFWDDGYECQGVSDYPFVYLYDLEYAYDGDIDKGLHYVAWKYDPDVMICYMQEKEPKMLLSEEEYYIEFAGEEPFYFLEKSTNHIFISYDFYEQDMWAAFESIKGYFLAE